MAITLIDFHTHAFPPAIARRTLDTLAQVSKITPNGDGTRDGVLEEMQRSEASLAVVLNVVTKPGQEHTVNATAQEMSRAEGNTLYFGSVHPKSADAKLEVERAHALGLKGIKIHPDYQGTTLWDESYLPIFEAAERLGLIVVTHAGWDPLSPDFVHATPEMAERVLVTFPRLKLVLAHFGGMHRYEEVEARLAGRFDHLYLDTAFSCGMIDSALARRIVQKHGAHRVLFGSDFPWHTIGEEADFVRALDISDEEKDLILHKNAERLLGLTV